MRSGMEEISKILLPKNLRGELKKPFGEVLKNIEDIGEADDLICVGDRVSKDALQAGYLPKAVVYDGRIMRKQVDVHPVIEKYNAEEIQVENPAGTITEEIFTLLEKVFTTEEKFKIHVEGEEDLVALAAIERAPLTTSLVYGQPREGLVHVKIDKKVKKRARKIINNMKTHTKEVES